MRTIYKSIMVLTILAVSIESRTQTFIVNDVVISDTTTSFQDPEIDWIGNHYCWADRDGIWIGKIDKKTGDFIPKNGKGIFWQNFDEF
ncbi:MAG TPA: hypothetical protein DCX89_07185 [Saprospirales bacterium]|nr:hypothetical protein [Saprospirales bacterium]